LILSTGMSHLLLSEQATAELYPLSLHDALPISTRARADHDDAAALRALVQVAEVVGGRAVHVVAHSECTSSTMRVRTAGSVSGRSEEHTSELQSRENLVCRLLLEKKKICIKRKV